MKRLLSLILTLLLLPAALAEPEEFTLRDGITWSSTPEEVEAIVGDLSWSEEMNGGLGGLVQAYSNIPFGNCSGEFQALFVGDYNQLVSMGYELSDFPEDQTLEQAVNDLKAGLDAKYTPVEFDLPALTELFSDYARLLSDDSPSFSEADISGNFYRWTAFDGTEIYLTDGIDDHWEIIYFNVPGIEDLLATIDAPNTNGL